jgi:hypothetical protein
VRILRGHPAWAEWDGAIEELPESAGADCKLTKLSGPDLRFVEVVRAEPNASYWKTLTKSRTTSAPKRTVEQMAERLWKCLDASREPEAFGKPVGPGGSDSPRLTQSIGPLEMQHASSRRLVSA